MKRLKHVKLFEEVETTSELDKNAEYYCALPISSDRKDRIYVKVKYLGKNKDGELIVSPVQEVRFIHDSGTAHERENSFRAGNHYSTSMQFMLSSSFAPLEKK